MTPNLLRGLLGRAGADRDHQPVEPIAPALSVASRVTAANGGFTLGVPEGFGPPPSDVRQSLAAVLGPTLAAVVDLGADDVPMIIFAHEIGVFPEMATAEGSQNLTRALRQKANDIAAHGQATLTDNPRSVLVGGAPAVYYAARSLEASGEHNERVLINHRGELIEAVMQTQPHLKDRYLPVWWTVLGSWTWSAPETVPPRSD